MRFTHLLAGLALSLGLVACGQPAPTPARDTSAEDAAAIRAHVDRFVEAWNAADGVAVGPLIAEDAILMQPDTPAVTGRDAILAVIAEGYDVAMIQQLATCDEVITLGDHAWARGTWHLNPTSAAEPEVQGTSGKWSGLYARNAAGQWELARWMWNQYEG